MDKLIISCCICGAEVTKENNPAVPYTVEEIAREAKSAYDAGAALIHLHGPAVLLLIPEEIKDLTVRPDRDTRRCQSGPCLLRDFLLLDKEDRLILRDPGIAQCHRRAFDIVPADVKEPADIIQTGQKQGIRPVLREFLPHLAKFLRRALSRDRVIYNKKIVHGKRRPLRPGLLRQIQIIDDPDLIRCQVLLQFPAEPGRHHTAVEAKGLSGLHPVL